MTGMLWYGAIGLSLGAGWSDWRFRRIPNWLSVSGLLLGIVANSLIYGVAGAKAALIGAGVALGLLLPFVVLRGIGAGDWKLMGALGAFLGPEHMLFVLFAATILAGVWACAIITWHRRWIATLKNIWELICGFVAFGFCPNSKVRLDNHELLALPFGTVVAIATPLCYWGIHLLPNI
jgi:prepilin peptidase CpaA